MAIYHLSIKYVSRRKGQAAVQAAAYRSGEKLRDCYYGLTYDYTKKGGIVYNNILLPPTTPKEYADRETLWNAVEHAEKRKDSRLAREVEFSLPVELSLSEQLRLVERYVTANFVSWGMCADVNIHEMGNGNPHAHVLLTTRTVEPEGFGAKNRKWDKRANVTLWRREWKNAQNREFERKGLDIRVSHESNVARNIDREPTIHIGFRAKEFERSGVETDRGNQNRAIEARNSEREEQKHQRERQRQRSRGRSR